MDLAEWFAYTQCLYGLLDIKTQYKHLDDTLVINYQILMIK